ncbi:NAD kinase [Marivirga harenae]|uniref:NAD kinase n=1 Tax=Marivirga harenae TaxID=2010992 RepID=UPI0026E06290|nr:NAD kinase [Marivirga harenae]WKV13693.1 NAD kinase [Marivirga harenae]|tara:strand:+ start:61809 stop:62696 length:888 start_codon:yes stop_codon:yes gene_type:complete
MPDSVKIAIHGKVFNEEVKPYIKKVVDFLISANVELIVSQLFADKFRKAFPEYSNFRIFKHLFESDNVDYLISLGGDGTLLEAVSYVGSIETPILGINTGRLGFLATTPKSKIEKALSDLLSKNYKIDSRALIRLETDSKVFGATPFALNEFAILKTDSSSMITVHTYVDGEYLNSYWADGLIVATPTGSTGYSLSCGGPIILPHSNNFVITPVSAHNLNVRPLIVSDQSVISFKIEGRSNKFLVSLDSKSHSVDSSIKMSVRKGDFKAKLITFDQMNYFDTLRQKLNWGLDLRN